MQRCPQCGGKNVHEQRVRDPETGDDLGSRTVCGDCQSVLRDDVDI